MVHLKKVQFPSDLSIVMGSVEELRASDSYTQTMHTQTAKPRVRLRKVVFKKQTPILKRNFELQTDSDVKIEDYQITEDGRIIDGSLGKIYKKKLNKRRGSSHDRFEPPRTMNGGDQPPPIVPVRKRSEDSFDYFAKYVAALMRNMQPREAITLQGEIISMIVEAHTSEGYEEV